MKCRHCEANITVGRGGYWRDESDDPGDGWGGDASCPARPRVDGRAQTHEPCDEIVTDTVTGETFANTYDDKGWTLSSERVNPPTEEWTDAEWVEFWKREDSR